LDKNLWTLFYRRKKYSNELVPIIPAANKKSFDKFSASINHINFAFLLIFTWFPGFEPVLWFPIIVRIC
jgi:hypothetical protein